MKYCDSHHDAQCVLHDVLCFQIVEQVPTGQVLEEVVVDIMQGALVPGHV